MCTTPFLRPLFGAGWGGLWTHELLSEDDSKILFSCYVVIILS